MICADLAAHAAGIDLAEAVRRVFNATSEKNGLATLLPSQASALAVRHPQIHGTEPGRTAYQARFEGYTLGPRGVSPAWDDLLPIHKAIWARLEKVVADAFAASLSNGRGMAEEVRHVRRGTEYEVVGEAEAQVSGYCTCPDGVGNGVLPSSRIVKEGNFLTIYRCKTAGKLWCRFTDEFRDGRFVTVTSESKVEGSDP